MSEQINKLGALADKSIEAGTSLQEFENALLAFVPPEVRNKVRRAIRLRNEFTDYLHALADACEFCDRRQSESDDHRDKIVQDAMARFKVSEESLDKGWVHRTWSQLNRLRAHRKRTATRDDVEDSK